MITVHGLYRSGTNYTRTLIKENSPIRVLESTEYYVHSLERYNKNLNSRRIVVYKKLDQWIQSISRRCYDLPAYYDVLWEHIHTPIKSTAGVPDENFSGQHEIILSLEKLHNLYYSYLDYVEGEKFLYNDILADPEGFLKSLNIPLNNELKLTFEQVPSSAPTTFEQLSHRYLTD